VCSLQRRSKKILWHDSLLGLVQAAGFTGDHIESAHAARRETLEIAIACAGSHRSRPGRPVTPEVASRGVRKGKLPKQTTARGHKTDTSETTLATSRDASPRTQTAWFAGQSVSRVIARVRGGKEGVDGSSPSQGSQKDAAHEPVSFAGSTTDRMLDVHQTSTKAGHGSLNCALHRGPDRFAAARRGVHRTSTRRLRCPRPQASRGGRGVLAPVAGEVAVVAVDHRQA
jgi:hypothetical protein